MSPYTINLIKIKKKEKQLCDLAIESTRAYFYCCYYNFFLPLTLIIKTKERERNRKRKLESDSLGQFGHFQSNVKSVSPLMGAIMFSPWKQKGEHSEAQFLRVLVLLPEFIGTCKDGNWVFLVVPGGKIPVIEIYTENTGNIKMPLTSNTHTLIIH